MPSFGIELRTIARRSVPVALAQLGMTLMAAVDTLLLGRVGVPELAACALGNVWEWTWLCLGFGLVTGMDAFVSHAHGRGDAAAMALALQRGIITAAIASLPVCAAMLLTRPGLELLGQDPEIAALAGRYNAYKLPVIPCFLVYTALRQYLQGRAIMGPATFVMWIGNAVHLPLSWALIFGVAGSPALGMLGAALAESIVFVLLVVGLVVWIRRYRLHDGAWQPWSRASFALPGILQTMRLGVPIGLQIAAEAWAFSIAALMAGWLDRVAVGSHQIAMNMVVLLFMLPLGISQAASGRIGNLIGAGDAEGLRQAIKASLCLGAGVAIVPAIGFTLLRTELPWLYSDELAMRQLAARLLPIAAAFQLFDAVQVVAGAILRGMGRPEGGALISILGYYVLALPLGYVFGLVWHGGLVGVWLGLAAGLMSIAATMSYLTYRVARRPPCALELGRATAPAA